MVMIEAHSDDDLLWGVLTPRPPLTRTQRLEAVADLRLVWATGAREQAEAEGRRLCDTLERTCQLRE